MLILGLSGILFLAIAASLAAQIYVSYAFGKWSEVNNGSGLTGVDVAERIMAGSGLRAAVEVVTKKKAVDHYDPRSHTVRLTAKVAEKSSVAALAIVAHELGHAQQHEEESMLIQMRNFLVPAVQVMAPASYMLITTGLFVRMVSLLWLGAFTFGAVVLFMFLTLPVEIDASQRGIKLLQDNGLMKFDEDFHGARQVLTAAALTYVAASVLSLGQLLRYITIARG